MTKQQNTKRAKEFRWYLLLFIGILTSLGACLTCSPAPTHASSEGSLKWSFPAGAGDPAIATDGTIYIGAGGYYLYAVNPDGSEKWETKMTGWITTSPAVGPDGTIYVGSVDGKLNAINPNGVPKWSYDAVGGINKALAIDSKGTVYIAGTRNLVAVNPDGTHKWSSNIICESSPAVGSEGTIYVASYNEGLIAFNPNGSRKWYVDGLGTLQQASLAIGADGTVYLGARSDHNLYAIRPNGTKKWSFRTGEIGTSPVIASDGTIYVGSWSGDYKLYAIRPDGTEKWSIEPVCWLASSPTIGSDGTIYVGGNNHRLYAFNPEGTERWSFQTGCMVFSSPAIGTDGTIYIAPNDGNLYAINSSSKGLASSPWPMFCHDVKHTGAARVITKPGMPRAVEAKAGNAQATVSFKAPVSNGGSAVTWYRVTSNPSGISKAGTTSSITVKGLINGTTYTFTVKAKNVAGKGPASLPSNAVTPHP